MNAITFENVSKKYRLGSPQSSLREVLGAFPRRLLGRNGTQRSTDYLWALRDVSFEVHSGESLGIIGPNGAGKTTILKLLSNVTKPTSGRISVRGRVASLIELGAGFHPDLTGRENIYLNGAILGLSRQEIESKFDSIVDFSGLERFIDTPVKRYSSGMYARLGFAVAAHVRPDVLVVDEVLAVGDMSFQAKCAEKMKELCHSHASVVYVSHNLPAVRELCSRAIYLEHGIVQSAGNSPEVLETYRQREVVAMLGLKGAERRDEEARQAYIVRTEMLSREGTPIRAISYGDSVVVRIEYFIPNELSDPIFSVTAFRADGVVCFSTSTKEFYGRLGRLRGQGIVECTIPGMALIPGTYGLGVYISDYHRLVDYDRRKDSLFSVTADLPIDSRFGVYMPYSQWKHFPI